MFKDEAKSVVMLLFLSPIMMEFPFRLSFNFLSFKLAILSPHSKCRYLSIVRTTVTAMAAVGSCCVSRVLTSAE